MESKQTDIIIYDNRVLPPFIQQQHIGVYPAESVIATIEVKSTLQKSDIVSANTAAKHLLDSVYAPSGSNYPEFAKQKPLCTLFGFRGKGMRDLSHDAKGQKWLSKNINNIGAICLLNQFSWITFDRKKWVPHFADEESHETKRFIAILVDNMRSLSEERMRVCSEEHRDWIGAYIRDQG